MLFWCWYLISHNWDTSIYFTVFRDLNESQIIKGNIVDNFRRIMVEVKTNESLFTLASIGKIIYSSPLGDEAFRLKSFHEHFPIPRVGGGRVR